MGEVRIYGQVEQIDIAFDNWQCKTPFTPIDQ